MNLQITEVNSKTPNGDKRVLIIKKEDVFFEVKSYADLIEYWFTFNIKGTFEPNDSIALYNLLNDFANNKFSKSISIDIFDTLYTIEKC